MAKVGTGRYGTSITGVKSVGVKERKAMKKISLDYVRVTEQEPTFLASLKSFVKDAVQYGT